MDNSEYISIAQFAKLQNVPESAVLNALQLNRLKTGQVKVDGAPVIHVSELVDYKFDLIGVYEYADRKEVSFNAVYRRIDNGSMLYSLEEVSDKMKIDWEIYKDLQFRKFTFKHRGKNKVA